MRRNAFLRRKVACLALLGVFLLIAFGVGVGLFHKNPISSLNPGLGKNVLDAHVHVAGLGYGGSGCFINKDMQENFRFPFYLLAMGTSEEELQKHGDAVLFKKLSQRIEQSVTVAGAVILAMDGYVEQDGTLNKAKTQLYVPNAYVARETSKFNNLHFGASINPNRSDAVERLRQAQKNKAVLVKWIPSIMNIDPADPRYIPFYRAMAELDIPLLSHTGMEKSFSGARDELADPQRLELPLQQGVTVIAAHIAASGKTNGEENFERILPLLQQYPALYVDISSLTQINKLGYLARALDKEDVVERMLYGTDWPLQFF
ncbi:MAG: metal-dependent hydrolase, partial [Candidatus Electrothrix sp. ATG1]|nr:metal-dependent hydrolase [Candidatus Electrothrix sp. ATG1]